MQVAGARRINRGLVALAAATCGAVLASRAAQPGDEVVVIYNSRMPESKGVAEYYAQRRQVPSSQVFGFPLSTNEDLSRKEFRDTLEKPLAKALEGGKLWRIGSRSIASTNNQPARKEKIVVETKIRYALLCYGVPLRIAADPELKEPSEQEVRAE